MSLDALLAEAKALGGDASQCLTGLVPHEWASEGGRACPNNEAENCSMPVYRCKRCGDYDYGEPGGPGHEDCLGCPRSVLAQSSE